MYPTHLKICNANGSNVVNHSLKNLKFIPSKKNGLLTIFFEKIGYIYNSNKYIYFMFKTKSEMEGWLKQTLSVQSGKSQE